MSISNVGTPTQQQVPEILWARGTETTEPRVPAVKTDAIDPTAPTPVTAAQQPEPPREPEQITAAAPDGQGRLLDRTV